MHIAVIHKEVRVLFCQKTLQTETLCQISSLLAEFHKLDLDIWFIHMEALTRALGKERNSEFALGTP